eukprot:583279-Prymnesium_polylepis.1
MWVDDSTAEAHARARSAGNTVRRETPGVSQEQQSHWPWVLESVLHLPRTGPRRSVSGARKREEDSE